MKFLLPLFLLISLTAQAQKASGKTGQHLHVIQKTDSLLASPENWHKSEDDRHCTESKVGGTFKVPPTLSTYSLYCALYQASVEIQGKYKHRGKVMATVRRVIKQENKRPRFKHPIRDFNNKEETSFEDIKSLIQKVIERL